MNQDRHPRRRRTILVVGVALLVGVALFGPSAAYSAWERPDLTVKLRQGDIVSLVFGPDAGSLGGTSAPVYSAASGRYLADFTTEIQLGPDVNTLLGIALSTGTSRTEAVELTLELGRGTLKEQHTANVAVLAEPPSPGYEFVVTVIGEGEIQPGTGVFRYATGTSSLFLVFEVDAEQQLPPVIRTGTLRFDID